MKVLLFLPKVFVHMESGVFIDAPGWAQHCLHADIRLVTAEMEKIKSLMGYPCEIRSGKQGA